MLKQQKTRLAALFAQAAGELAARAGVDLPAPEVTLERPKQAAHGDLACNLAMQLARPLKASPRNIAEALVEQVRALDAGAGTDALIEALEIAGPGFINIRLRAAAKRAAVAAILADGASLRRRARGAGRQVRVEVVSAKPTAPQPG